MTKATTYTAKATFIVEKTKKGERKFVAVNKRAKTVAKKLGKRKHLSVQELRGSVGKGSYQFYAYENLSKNANGSYNYQNATLAKIRF